MPRMVATSEPNGQGLQRAERERLPPRDALRRQPDRGQAAQERADRDLSLQAGKRGAEAEVYAPAECEVAVVPTAEVHAIRLREMGRVAVGGTEQAQHERALGNRALV